MSKSAAAPRAASPSGVLYALYRAGPSGRGFVVPIGNCVVFDLDKRCCLTATHVLRQAPRELCSPTEIQPVFVAFMVRLHLASVRSPLFEILEHRELVDEVTALWLAPVSHDHTVAFPIEQAFPPTRTRVKILFPVLISGFPATLQTLNIRPDDDHMEMVGESTAVVDYHVSGIVAGYYREAAPAFLPRSLLPAFLVDNAVLPGMSGSAVLQNLPNNNTVVGMVIKNLAVGSVSGDGSVPGQIVNALCVCLADIEVS